jgi:hypothetical protein
LRLIAIDPRHLGAEIGGVAVLHSWGQAMQHHPHVHCIVPGGGLSPDRRRWVACRPGFFLSVKVLGRLFRRLFLERLAAAFADGGLRFFGDLAPLAEPHAFAAHCAALRRIDWVVYAKPPFGGPEQVLAYLGRYTHRVAIANSRVVAITDDAVSFRWKDYRQEGRPKVMTLEPAELMRRFLLQSCLPASTASATSASSPTAIEQAVSRFVDSCWPNPPRVGTVCATPSLATTTPTSHVAIRRAPTFVPPAAASPGSCRRCLAHRPVRRPRDSRHQARPGTSDRRLPSTSHPTPRDTPPRAQGPPRLRSIRLP